MFERAGLNIEFEERHVLPILDQPGKVRIGLFSNEGNSANYRDIVTLTQLGAFGDINDAAAATRRPRRKSGGYINLEQALTPELGLFARASVGDGRTENISFTDIDQSFSGGLSLKGKAWDRPDDTVGLGAAMNGLSPSHRAAFANGYYGLLIGDGQLRYGTERAIETYYALNLTKFVTLTFDYQFIDNPAYNRDRGRRTSSPRGCTRIFEERNTAAVTGGGSTAIIPKRIDDPHCEGDDAATPDDPGGGGRRMNLPADIRRDLGLSGAGRIVLMQDEDGIHLTTAEDPCGACANWPPRSAGARSWTSSSPSAVPTAARMRTVRCPSSTPPPYSPRSSTRPAPPKSRRIFRAGRSRPSTSPKCWRSSATSACRTPRSRRSSRTFS